MTQDYELEIIGDSGSIFRSFDVDGFRTIGVKKDEPFEIRFKNHTGNLIQVRFSLDGTDILTGEVASTKPTGKMWVVGAYDTMSLKSWPETNNGGARFVFTNKEKSVAVNTHGNTSGIGLIAAAVYVEYNGYYTNFNTPPYTWCINPPNITMPNMYKYGDVIYGSGTTGVINTGETFDTYDASNFSGGTYATSDVSIAASACNDVFTAASNVNIVAQPEENFAIGAGEYAAQQLNEVGGLLRPVLDDVIQIKYLPWSVLSKKISKQEQKTPNAFPGDKKNINLDKVPKVQKPKKQPLQEQYRFAS